MDECGYMNSNAVASALTYATNRGVTIMMLCSPVESSNWLSKLDEVRDGDQNGVCVISLRYLCSSCARDGKTGICVHGSLKLPWHIETGGDISSDPVRQIMDLVLPGAYQQEICGFNDHTKERETEVFSYDTLSQLVGSNCISVSECDQSSADSIFVSMDPVQAGSSTSGIGVAVVLQISEIFVVSFLLDNQSSFHFIQKSTVPYRDGRARIFVCHGSHMYLLVYSLVWVAG